MSQTTNRLPPRQLSVLAERLRELPPEILYLRDAALHFAEQDQDALAAGDADLSVFEKVCRKDGVNGNVEHLARHASLLTTWLEERDAKGRWAEPLWTLLGTLRGCTLFSGGCTLFSERGDVEPEAVFRLQKPTVSKPLRRLHMNVPDGWESSELPDGNWMLSVNGVFVNVFVLSASEYKTIASRKRRLGKDSAVIPTTEESFRSGESRGKRTLFHLKQNGELHGISYVLAVPGGFVSASASAFTPGSLRPALLDPIIATFRFGDERTVHNDAGSARRQ